VSMTPARTADPPLVLVLCGPCGAGKSSTGNTLLASQSFAAGRAARAVTTACEFASTHCSGREVILVDTPGLSDPETSVEAIHAEITRGVALIAAEHPGARFAILLVASIAARVDGPVVEAFDSLRQVFGPRFARSSLLVLTHADLLTTSASEYLAGSGPAVADFLSQLGGAPLEICNRPAEEASRAIARLVERAAPVSASASALAPPPPRRKAARRERQRELLQCEKMRLQREHTLRLVEAARWEERWAGFGAIAHSLVSCLAPSLAHAAPWSAAPVGEVSPGEYWREKARRQSDSLRR